MSVESRFDRLEVKLDKLADAIATIARVEEKIIASNEHLRKAEKRIEKTQTDVDNLYEIVRKNSMIVKFIDKIFWLIITPIIAGCAGLLFWYYKK
jgi:septal ring factor EnvC (AmiA/AmiB activator)